MTVTHLKIVKPSTRPERVTHTTVDTIMLSPELVASWKIPGFQREVSVNAKVVALTERLKMDGGVLPGIITLGRIGADTYIVDGQHRLHAFVLSALAEGFCDVRICHFGSMADMASEFVELNSAIKRLRPDDVLRGLEPSTPMLSYLRQECPFVGYDYIRRSEKAPLLSMSSLLRAWHAGSRDVPDAAGAVVAQLAEQLTQEEAARCAGFLKLAVRAWGRDPENIRLWSGLNLSLTMWLYRRLVLNLHRDGASRSIQMTKEEFVKCMQACSASEDYLSWLLGRLLRDRDRPPAYRRLKGIYTLRLQVERGVRAGAIKLPQPPWAPSSGAS